MSLNKYSISIVLVQHFDIKIEPMLVLEIGKVAFCKDCRIFATAAATAIRVQPLYVLRLIFLCFYYEAKLCALTMLTIEMCGFLGFCLAA
jgi:hypothetical protein